MCSLQQLNTSACSSCLTREALPLMCLMQDGSMHTWSLHSFTPLRSFSFGAASSAQHLLASFCLSPDGLLAVGVGPQLPLLLMFSTQTGALLHGMRLPMHPAEVQGATQAAFLPESRTAAVLCVDGVVGATAVGLTLCWSNC